MLTLVGIWPQNVKNGIRMDHIIFLASLFYVIWCHVFMVLNKVGEQVTFKLATKTRRKGNSFWYILSEFNLEFSNLCSSFIYPGSLIYKYPHTWSIINVAWFPNSAWPITLPVLMRKMCFYTTHHSQTTWESLQTVLFYFMKTKSRNT